MSRPDATEFPAYAAAYVDRVPGDDVMAALAAPGLAAALGGADERWAGSFAYAPGKWTAKEVAGHVADTERVFAYRILAVARGERGALPGFEQDDYVRAGRFHERSLADLLDDLQTVRQGTLRLLRGLPAAAWSRRGTANAYSVTVRGLAFMLAGHELHHLAILRAHYLPHA